MSELHGTDEDRLVSAEFRAQCARNRFPWCDTCRMPAVWREGVGWLHSTDRHSFGLPRHMDTSGHEVTATQWDRGETPPIPTILPGTICEQSGTRVHVMGPESTCRYCDKDLILVAIDDVPPPIASGELRQLLLDWIDKSLSYISEYGGSSDWPPLIKDAQRRARILGIDWTPQDLPSYVKDLLALHEED